MEKKYLRIAAGIIRDSNNKIFITQRSADSHMGGFWEFPGGKLEEEETPNQALIRELQEEVGITVTHCELVDTVIHDFPDRNITLYFFLVHGWKNEPFGKEGQPSRWVLQSELIADEFPPANRSIVDFLTKSDSH
ncbi:8-oxo-dGTP diphosphatase MutT [Xenorhabdus nematophila]|uniref:8-oxo-dGTP diphosphatase n=1 Tax=Xenorhabdus nematophila (strain ATCC 19061 / DSM 3370 / CCUG 14189 / LMG 1036 / NCIMB 9965 / AN6) TaxID=406817 RepID=D3V8U3_XENNA|nr:8-oxo-dGTP diphosphatase MutT [Xenorhabdus nematophila]CEE93652.1 7,8-dihydro-8-oxoguanine-triphosphatase, prefers dGTP [Xenorhabdus nematophila str. Anatoliense]CEF30843.1 7,8-dihydro-8-oxoguanine-triphosphatase, prefers dGTP [Xenorhabdus nematophila str. Websteri]AYA40889.1 8-oxo-dGTP diphosphatase MutT [Xenorhabdus nematophila]MBA0019637.1 8-oxo-dGTP diphosphatase MutT [Xenorhabdus nematophila]MCB4423994.1 8-oxo-dGTP diphosphatase MutT [Xenorhabdus nematophila]